MMDVITRVELAYYDLIAAGEQVTVQEQALQLAEKLLAENKKRVEVGAMAPLDEKQAEAQVASSRADLLSAQQLQATRENDLKALLAAEYSDWQMVIVLPSDRLLVVPQAFNVQASWMNGLVLRPELIQSRLTIEKQGITIEYAKNQLYPLLNVTGRYGLSGLSRDYGGFFQQIGDGQFQSAGVGVQLTVPLGNSAARNNLKVAKANKDQLLLQLKKQEQDVMVQIDNAVKTAKTSLQRVSATAEARDYAKLAYEAEQKKLENGKSTSFVVLQLQRDYTTAYASYIRALADYNRAVALLSQAEGTTLEHYGMNLTPRPPTE
jgi:outer membrane protein TolC